jgi:3-methylfumaryl-CoA hydratase
VQQRSAAAGSDDWDARAGMHDYFRRVLALVHNASCSKDRRMHDVVERTEMILPEPAYALGALLSVQVPDLDRGEGLPLLWHWVYLLDRPAQSDLGWDGQPVRGAIAAAPDQGQRRMWAGGRVRASGTLRCGEPATKRSRLRTVQKKRGRSGVLTFMTVERQIQQGERTVIDEQQDIVYREPAPPGGPAPGPSENVEVAPAPDEWAIDVSPTLLFRFSALTYNAHRIHYDRDYARDVEGYPGLLTHGPLQALAMAEAARGSDYGGIQQGSDQRFEYRLIAPLFDHQGMVVSAARERSTMVTAVRDRFGRRTATGTLGVLP